MICRVAWRVLNGSGAADERSDDEESVFLLNYFRYESTDFRHPLSEKED